MKLYAISGLGADQRTFKHLNLDYQIIPINWIPPKKGETIQNYSQRLSQVIDTSQNFAILGVSFGGLVAVEISKIFNPKLTILISSAETNRELRTIYNIVGKTKIIRLLPEKRFKPPKTLANWLFGAINKQLLGEIIDDTDLKFAKWAIGALTTWKNTNKLKNRTLKISGTNDKLIPPINDKSIKLIKKGEHFMVVDRADEISNLINAELKAITSQNRF